MRMIDILKIARDNKGSDVHITAEAPPIIRIDGLLKAISVESLSSDDTKKLVQEVLNDLQFKTLENTGDIDCSFTSPLVGRFRVNAFKQRGRYSIVMRVINSNIPTVEELNIPTAISNLTEKTSGLILVTGLTGSGKSTTLASLINKINKTKNKHIITIEDPIEFIHKNNKCLINQREIGEDTESFSKALRSALREDPDVILVGEMRDLETISTTLTAAETGHLVLSTLHTNSAVKTIDRIIDIFPPHQQQQIRIQLSSVLQAVISQQLLPLKNSEGRVAIQEIMLSTNAIQNLIREGKTHQIQNVIQTSKHLGMISMDNALIDAYNTNIISKKSLLEYASDINIDNI